MKRLLSLAVLAVVLAGPALAQNWVEWNAPGQQSQAAGSARGVFWVDFDGDGDDDLFTVDAGLNRLYRNDGGPRFTEVSSMGPQNGVDWDADWGDFDNDGDLDVYVAGSPSLLFANNGNSLQYVHDDGTPEFFGAGNGSPGDQSHIMLNRFLAQPGGEWIKSISVAWPNAGIPGVTDGMPATVYLWSDPNQDGDPSDAVVIASAAVTIEASDPGTYWFVDYPITPTQVTGSYFVGYRLEAFATPGGLGSRLVDTSGGVGESWVADNVNNGSLDPNNLSSSTFLGNIAENLFIRANGYADSSPAGFTNVTTPIITNLGDVTRSAAWGDYDNDGDLDLVTVGDAQSNLFRNEGGGLFSNNTPPVLLASTGFSVMFVDYDNDGDVDISGAMNGSVRLLRNDGGGTFADVSTPGMAAANLALDVSWGDVNADGQMDLYITRGALVDMLLQNAGGGVFNDISAAAGITTPMNGRTATFLDADNDGDSDIYVANWIDNANVLYLNDGTGVFTDSGETILQPCVPCNSPGVAVGDADGDGLVDIYLSGFEQNWLFRNNQAALGNDWIGVRLVGTTSNRSSIGARITVNGVARQITGGNGPVGNSLTQYLGLGNVVTPTVFVFVDWPSGASGSFEVSPNQVVTFVEPGPPPSPSSVSPNAVTNQGPFTVDIFGIDLNGTTGVSLQPSLGGTNVPATAFTILDATHVEATFDLSAFGELEWNLIVDGFSGGAILSNVLASHADDADFFRVNIDPANGNEPCRGVGPFAGTVLYSSDEFGGQRFIAVRDLATGALNAILGKAGARNPSLSGDGTQITYNIGSQIWAGPAADTTLHTVVAAGSDPAWSPVDNRIAFVGFKPIFVIDLDAPGAPAPVAVTNPLGSPIFDGGPIWSPDGTRIAFQRGDAGNLTVLTVDAALGEIADGVITVSKESGNAAFPSWSPSGKLIAYQNDNFGDMAIVVAESGGRWTSDIISLGDYPGDIGVRYHPAWVDDETLLLEAFWSSQTEIVVATNIGALLDSDGDGFPDAVDACPALPIRAGESDRDFDGCPDPGSSFRYVRWWPGDITSVSFETDAVGHPGIGDGSDFTALASAFAHWTGLAIPGLAGGDDGLRAGPTNAVSGDGRNTVSFQDPDGFLPGILAITPSTVAVSDTMLNGRAYAPGEVIDSDVLFNLAQFAFETPTAPAGVPGAFSLEAVATHEFGHLWGCSHSADPSATMFYVVPQGDQASSLDLDDSAWATRSYYDGGAPLTTLRGTVYRPDGATPVVGAAVLALAEDTGDTLQMTVTDLDGNYSFWTLPGNVRVYVLPLDGSSDVNGLTPAIINAQLDAVAETDFLPEYYDAAETNSDFGTSGDVVLPDQFGIDIILNADGTGPTVVSTYPADSDIDVSAITAISVKFDEKIDAAYFASNPEISLAGPGGGVGGVAAILGGDSLLVFTPSAPLQYLGAYTLDIGPDIRDISGNPMSDNFVVAFTVEAQPPVTLSSVTPGEFPLGANIVIYGTGFDPNPAGNAVQFSGAAPIAPDAATPDRLFVTVPGDAQSGALLVDVGGTLSNSVDVVVLPPKAPPLGNLLDAVALGEDVRKLALTPDGARAYVATDQGLVAVDSDPLSATFLDLTPIGIPGGVSGVAMRSDGRRAVVTGVNPPALHLVDTDPASASFNTVIATAGTVGVPRGLALAPGGAQVLVSQGDRVVLHSTGPATFGNELRDWSSAGRIFLADVAFSAGGGIAYAPTGDGKIAVLGLAPTEGILTFLNAGTQPRELVSNPAGLRLLGVDGDGTVRLWNEQGPIQTTLPVGGGFRGVALSPEGSFAYGANYTLNRIDVFNLQTGGLLGGDMFPTGVDPLDVAVGPGGRYLYVVTGGGNELEVYDTENGPVIASLSPPSGGPFVQVTVAGSGFSAGATVTLDGAPQVVLEVDPAGEYLVFEVQQDATTGAVQVQSGGQLSNTRPFRYVNRFGSPVTASPVSISTPGTTAAAHPVVSPTGNLVLAISGGTMHVIRSNPARADFHTEVQTLPHSLPNALGNRVVFLPNGDRFFAQVSGGGIREFFVDETAANPVTPGGLVQVLGGGGDFLNNLFGIALTPDGSRIYGTENPTGTIFEIDTDLREVVATMGPASVGAGPAIAVHPLGDRLFVGSPIQGGSASGAVFDIQPSSANFRTELATFSVSGNDGPYSFAAGPTGEYLFSESKLLGISSYIQQIDADAASPTYLTQLNTEIFNNSGGPSRMAVQHSGNRLFVQNGLGLVISVLSMNFTLTQSDPNIQLTNAKEIAISPDDARLYVSAIADSIVVYDLSNADTAPFTVSGYSQFGVQGRPLAQPLVVARDDDLTGYSVGGLAIFEADANGGVFGNGSNRFVTAFRDDGFAYANYTPGDPAAPDQITVRTATGTIVNNIPVYADTASAAPQIVLVKPATATPAGVNTTVSVDFSKAIPPGTVSAASFQVRPVGGSPLPGIFTYALGGRRVVFKPANPLAYSSSYEFQITNAITDYNANPLANPGTFSFSTVGPPPLALYAVENSSARVGDPVVLSGQSFASTASLNTVLFGGVATTAAAGDPGALRVNVPLGASSGAVRVVVGPDTSNAVGFAVIVPNFTNVAGETATTQVPTSGQQIAVTPDGARAYMTSPSANSVVPIDLSTQLAESSIPVGLYPFGVTTSPTGDRTYVTNYQSDDVSVIDGDPTHSTFQQVIAVMPSGKNPTGIASHPDGRSLYVTNYGDSTMTIFDTDSTSAGAYSARASLSTGSSSSSVVVTPDGAWVIVGTSSGILIVDSVSGAARASLSTGSSTQSVVVTPDGALAVILTVDGDLILMDIVPGSATEGSARASLNTGSSSQSVVVSPDGAFAFVTRGDGTVGVYQIIVTGGGAAVASEEAGATYQIVEVASIDVGENPTGITYDAANDQVLVVNSGSKSVSYLGFVRDAGATAEMDFSPNSLNFSSKGKWVQADLYFPAFLDPDSVDVASVRLEGSLGVVASRSGTAVDSTGREYFTAKFDRQDAYEVLPQGEFIKVTVTGLIQGLPFTACDSITVKRPDLLSPLFSDVILTGEDVDIRWTPSAYGTADRLDIYWSWNDGAEWDTVVVGTPDDSVHTWTVPDIPTTEGAILLVARDEKGDITGISRTHETFTVAAILDAKPTLPVRFALHAPSPNPSFADARIRFDLPEARAVTLQIYSVNGRLVKTILEAEAFPAGTHEVTWTGDDEHGRSLARGVYFLRINTPTDTAVKKLVRMQ